MFTEITVCFPNFEFMIHESNNGEFIRLYTYKNEIKELEMYDENDKKINIKKHFIKGSSPLFVHLNEKTMTISNFLKLLADYYDFTYAGLLDYIQDSKNTD